MKSQPGFSKVVWLCRLLFGRRARWVYLAFILALVVFSIGLRVRSYLLTRKIYAVLFGLEQVRMDVTTEEQLKKVVPQLSLVHTSRGEQRSYRVEILNGYRDLGWTRWVPSFLFTLWPGGSESQATDKWTPLPLPFKVAYLLGWRNIAFAADAVVLNGRVSSVGYSLEPDVLVSMPVSYFIVARGTHGFWVDRARRPVPVSSAGDESPDYRFGLTAGEFSFLPAPDSKIGVAYTPEAPHDLASHVFRLDLSCFWGLRGCDSVRQVSPLLWKDRHAIAEATYERLTSADPCPDRILAGRVRTLADLNVALLEVVDSRSEEINREGDRFKELVTDFRLIEAIHGNPQGPWTNIRWREAIPSPLSATGTMGNPLQNLGQQPGGRFLYFSGANFDSCRIVPATPSAESAVRAATPPLRRREDDIAGFFGRL